MRKLLLLSVVVAMVVVPIIAARSSNPKRGLRNAVLMFVLCNGVYILAISRFIRSPF